MCSKKVYKSKISWGLIGVPFALFFVVTAYMVYEEEALNTILITSGILLAAALFIAHIAYAMRYMITDGLLYVQWGIWYRRHLEASRITEIKRTKDPISAPAASLDRPCIAHSAHGVLIISPKEKEAFVQQLLNINPNIIQSVTHENNR
jgi:hypothetical protein